MRSKLFEEQPKTIKTASDRWVRIMPVNDNGYRLYDLLQNRFIGLILIDTDDNWIYDGDILSVQEQEETAGAITGNHREMENLIRSL